MITRISLVILFSILPGVLSYASHHESPLNENSGNASSGLEKALASEARSERDRARDAGRKPVEVVDLLGIRAGMTVVDLIAAAGFYTEVLSLAVGSTGRVYAQNGARVLQLRDGANEKAISKRLSNDRLPNVTRINREISEMDLQPGSIDAAITALNFHDIYNGGGPQAALGVSKIVLTILKPNGVFGVIDHQGNSGNDNASLHRIEVGLVVETLEKAGFKIEQSSLLANPDDRRDKNVFDPSVRGKTDRFVILARKPAGP